MPIIAVANQKGGVGKTTTAVNLAAGLAVSEFSVCLIDCDPQANATTHLFDRDLIQHTFAEVVCPSHQDPRSRSRAEHLQVEQAVYETSLPKLDLLPSSISLGMFERQSALELDRFISAITSISRNYDFVILDCPPSLGLIFTGVIKSATHVIIPVAANFLALEGMADLMYTLKQQQQYRDIHILGILVTMYDVRLNTCKEAKQMILDEPDLGPRVFATMITTNSRLMEAPSFHVSIYQYEPANRTNSDGITRGIQQFDELVNELLARLKVDEGLVKTKKPNIKKIK